jgi:D-arabinose 1-dehydrogenase-like Zn-dependent alcohol dehydrogenase
MLYHFFDYRFASSIAIAIPGNTGMITVQLGKKMGAKVIAFSEDNWIRELR